jgi:tetratricopeptide (TPR) repeat protein
MENDPQSALGHLNRGIGEFGDGELEDARRHFAQALLQEPDNELAWLWLAEASETPGQKRYCFDRAVAIDPDSAGLFRRDALRAAGIDSEVPPVIRIWQSLSFRQACATRLLCASGCRAARSREARALPRGRPDACPRASGWGSPPSLWCCWQARG